VEIFKPKMKEGETAPNIATDEENDKKAAILNRYKADYSRWGTWTPTDEVSLAEAAEIQQREEDARNKEFEKNNSEFCTQFVSDMENRKKVTEKKQESADISRLKGNRYFKTRAYDKALEYYMDALKDCPFDAKTVNNIAQVMFPAFIDIHCCRDADVAQCCWLFRFISRPSHTRMRWSSSQGRCILSRATLR
jgi:tetratricopeptide (TPR) repeat protein